MKNKIHSFQFLYITEEMIAETIKECNMPYPDCMGFVQHEEYISKKATIEEAVVDFYDHCKFDTLFDVDEEVEARYTNGDIKDIRFEFREEDQQ